VRARLVSMALGLIAGWYFGQGREAGRSNISTGSIRDSSEDRAALPEGDQDPLSPTGGEPKLTEGHSGPEGAKRTRMRRLIERLDHARVDEFPSIWEETLAANEAAWGRMEFPMSANDINYLIMHEWVSQDADGAWEYFQSITRAPADGSGGKVETFMSAWLAVDPDSATRQLTTSSWDELDGGLRRALARHDPQLALAHWQENAEPGSAVPATILGEIARSDPHAAFDLLVPAGGGAPDKRALASIIRGWPVDRLDELLPRLSDHQTQFPPTDLEASYRSIGGMLAKQGDLRKSLDWILSQNDVDLRGKILHGMLQQNMPINHEALSRIAALPHEDLLAFDNFKDVLGANMDDRAKAWEWLQSLDPEVREKALSSGGISDFARSWALIDLDAAFGMVDAIAEENTAARDDLVEGLARASGERHPLEGLALASQLPAELREEFGQTLAKRWSGYDPEGFLEHLDSVPDGPQLEALQRGGFMAIAAQSPELAGDLLLDLFATGDERARHAGELVDTWVFHDRPGAAAWVAQLPDELHGAAAENLGDALSKADPVAAAQAYLSIRDPEARAAVLQQHYTQLASVDHEAARELVRNTPMEASMRQEILDGIDANAKGE